MPKKPKNKPRTTDPANAPETNQAAARNAATQAGAQNAAAQGAPPDELTGVPSEGREYVPPNGRAAVGENERDLKTSELGPLRAELEEAKDRALRSQAELENYRKRAAREMQEGLRYANLPLMRDLLPVLDNMERAIEAAEKTHDAASLLEGVKLVAQQLGGVLERYDCVRIEALNEPFDPHLHEAISQQPSDQHPAHIVLLVTQTGFQLHDRVVRPSQVIVSTTDQQEQ